MQPATRDAIADVLATHDAVVELAVGRRTAVAAELAERGVDVTATDVRERTVPEGVAFVRDDLADPDPSVYDDAEALYALNLPTELQRPAGELADGLGVALYFTTLGAEQPAIPVTRRTLPGETLFAFDPVGGSR